MPRRRCKTSAPSMKTYFQRTPMQLLKYAEYSLPLIQFGTQTHGPGLRRLPFIYAQDLKLATSLEKLIYQVLRSVYRTLGTAGWSSVSAWGEMNPRYGFRVGDSDEIIESTGLPLLNPDRLASA